MKLALIVYEISRQTLKSSESPPHIYMNLKLNILKVEVNHRIVLSLQMKYFFGPLWRAHSTVVSEGCTVSVSVRWTMCNVNIFSSSFSKHTWMPERKLFHQKKGCQIDFGFSLMEIDGRLAVVRRQK